MLDEFRKFQVEKRECQLLSYDFGGGTIDISLVDVKIHKSPTSGRISIDTELKGLSGEANYGGDNVTLEVFKMIKKRLAIKVAEAREDDIGSLKNDEGDDAVLHGDSEDLAAFELGEEAHRSGFAASSKAFNVTASLLPSVRERSMRKCSPSGYTS